jgi:chromate transporter
MELPVLFWEFCKIGFFAVGGGLATLPFLFHLAGKYERLTLEIIGSGQALAQSAPGAIGVNMAANAGFYANGVAGAFTAAFALIFPSIIVITIVARMFESFKENRTVKAVFAGLRPASGGLLCAAGFGAFRLSLYNPDFSIWYRALRLPETFFFLVFFLITVKLKPHPIVSIVLAAFAGVFFKFS